MNCIPCCSCGLDKTRREGASKGYSAPKMVMMMTKSVPSGGVEVCADVAPQIPQVAVPKDEPLCLTAPAGVDVHLDTHREGYRGRRKRQAEAPVNSHRPEDAVAFKNLLGCSAADPCFTSFHKKCNSCTGGRASRTHLASCGVPLGQRCEHVTVELPLELALGIPHAPDVALKAQEAKTATLLVLWSSVSNESLTPGTHNGNSSYSRLRANQRSTHSPAAA